MFHWLFVPLTLGLSFLLAIMESLYVKTNDIQYKIMTQFWMKLFAINFAIGVATGIIMEFEFGTNWSSYSWIVGDIFGAPLAIEGMMAFFLESTFFALMFFGWNKVSKKAHLFSTWMVAIGSNLSALWILVANGWMQFPTGTYFNMDSGRNEMINFFDVLLSPVAVSKFLHTISSGFVTGALFMIAVSAWFLLKKRDTFLAKKSILIASSFGLLASLYLAFTGDRSAYEVAQKQPTKLAAMEGLVKGGIKEELVLFGLVNPAYSVGSDEPFFLGDLAIPYALSFLAQHNIDAFVPGIDDLVYGNKAQNIMSASEKIRRGKMALHYYSAYVKAKKVNNLEKMKLAKELFDPLRPYMGYGYLNTPEQIIPNTSLSFYSFHIMVGLGSYFIIFFIATLYFSIFNTLENKKWFLYVSILTFPLAFVAGESGWVLAEVGRQPWVIYEMLPTFKGVSNLDSDSVAITFWLFAFTFTTLLIAEIRIMLKEITHGFSKGAE
ncbi:MAG: cytochrome ubiquinol oxidase subunit I [Helicobacteraceae bacterium]|nr:cytochrome ubiquinol oxidase subunit I [Helicobacteraceae bacterium]